MNLQGKHINFLGDSITAGYMTSSEEKRFTNLIAERTGAICHNFGANGTEVAKKAVFDPTHVDFCARAQNMYPSAEYFVVFGGTNDFGHNIPLGTKDDRTPDTFYGALHTLYGEINNYFNSHSVIFFTPIHRRTEVLKPVNDAGSRLEEYADAVKEVAEYYNCPVLDLFAECPFDLRDEKDVALYGEDGLHPNDKGHVLLADTMIKFFEHL